MSDFAREACAIALYESRVRSTAGWDTTGYMLPRSAAELDVQMTLYALTSIPSWHDLTVADRRHWRELADGLTAEPDPGD